MRTSIDLRNRAFKILRDPCWAHWTFLCLECSQQQCCSHVKHVLKCLLCAHHTMVGATAQTMTNGLHLLELIEVMKFAMQELVQNHSKGCKFLQVAQSVFMVFLSLHALVLLSACYLKAKHTTMEKSSVFKCCLSTFFTLCISVTKIMSMLG